MPPSQVRKEEAELRKIAKQARDTRKQVKAREKKQQQRRAKDVVEGSAVATASTPRKRQAAMILPDEVTELRGRLGLASSSSPAEKGGKHAKASPKKAAAKQKSAGKSAAAEAANAGPSPQAVPEPPYHLEVHFRRKELLVDVTLHKIPESKIDISETNATQLVVDTTKHTKKWRLVLPYPEGVTVDSEAGTYELESGVLRCRIPLVGDMPAHLQEKWDAVVQKMREQRAMRFRVTQDGSLTVRTRRALLMKDGEVPAAKKPQTDEDAEKAEAAAASSTEKPAKKGAQKRGRQAEAEAEAEAPKKTAPAPQANGKKAAAAPAAKRAKTEAATAPAAPAAAAATPSKRVRAKKQKTDVFKQDHERAMEIAKASAVQSKASIRERVQQALVVQKKRQAKMDTREVRKAQKLDRRQQSLAKVLQQQKAQLLAQAAMVESAKPKPAAAKKDTGKTVSFAG